MKNYCGPLLPLPVGMSVTPLKTLFRDRAIYIIRDSKSLINNNRYVYEAEIMSTVAFGRALYPVDSTVANAGVVGAGTMRTAVPPLLQLGNGVGNVPELL